MEITNLPETMPLETAARYVSAELGHEFTVQDLLWIALTQPSLKGDGSVDGESRDCITLSLRFFDQMWLRVWEGDFPGYGIYPSISNRPLDIALAGACEAVINSAYQKSRGINWKSDASGFVFVKVGNQLYSIMRDNSLDATHVTASEISDLAELVVRSDNLASFLESRKALVAKDTPVNAAPSGSPESKESKVTDATPTSWIEQVRAIALEYIAKHKANDLFPSQKDVCRHVESVARKQKIYGPQGKPLSQSYIQRNAIQGDWWQKNKP